MSEGASATDRRAPEHPPLYRKGKSMTSLTQISGGQWTLGVKIGLPIACIGALILIVAVGCLITAGFRDNYGDGGMFFAMGGFALLALAGLVFGVGFALWPWQSQYHQYRPVAGTVAQISSRIVSAGDDGGSEQKFVVVLTSGPQQYALDDTRAALLHVGDPVSMRCVRSYDYGSNDAGYDCKWGQS